MTAAGRARSILNLAQAFVGAWRARRPEPPLLADFNPTFALELEQLLLRGDNRRLASSVAALRVVELCRCGDPRCSSFYAIPRFVVRWRWPAHGETVKLDASRGTLSVDVVDGEIASVEVLDRPDVLRSLAPPKKEEDTE